MSVQVVYKNKAKSSNSGVIALFADEKFQIINARNYFDFMHNYRELHSYNLLPGYSFCRVYMGTHLVSKF